VNYHLIGDRFVVDRVLDRAELRSGVGDSKVSVKLTRNNRE
jgi:type IV secretory pathway VirB9-like protein